MKPHRFIRPATHVVALALLVGVVTGCGGDSGTTEDRTGSRSAPATSPAPAPAEGEIVLPIDAYALSTPDVARMGRVRELVTGVCMRRFGFEFDAQGVSAESAVQDRISDVGVHGNRRRYGITEEAQAQKYGYHLASTVNRGPSASPRGRSDHGLGEMTPAKQAVLFGQTAEGKALTQVGGEPVPRGGCLGEARSKITSVGELTESTTVSRIANESFKRSLNDPAVAAAIGRWSACMKARGHTYPNPLEAAGAFDLQTPTVSAKEIAVARADVQCKREVDLVKVWMGFEVRYQQAEIEKHAEELRTVKAERDQQLKRVAEILATGS